MDHHVDALIVEAVEHIRDRFGPYGLRDLIELATVELDKAEAAMRSVREPEDVRSAETAETGDA